MVGDVADAGEVGPQGAVFGAEAARERGFLAAEPVRRGRVPQRPQRVQDDGDVDELLEERTPHGRQVAEGGDDHGAERQADADDDALEGDAAAAAGDDERFAEPVETIDGEYDVGGFR